MTDEGEFTAFAMAERCGEVPLSFEFSDRYIAYLRRTMAAKQREIDEAMADCPDLRNCCL